MQSYMKCLFTLDACSHVMLVPSHGVPAIIEKQRRALMPALCAFNNIRKLCMSTQPGKPQALSDRCLSRMRRPKCRQLRYLGLSRQRHPTR